jgi:hypothetical protein
MKSAAKTVTYTVIFIAITLAVFMFMAESPAGAFITNLVIAISFWHALENSLGIIGVDGEEDLIFWSYIFLGCFIAGIVFLCTQLRLTRARSFEVRSIERAENVNRPQ